MSFFWQLFLAASLGGVLSDLAAAHATPLPLDLSSSTRLAQASSQLRPSSCPQQPVLARLKQHQVQPEETLESIAQQYKLLPSTLMGINPALRQGPAEVGTTIVIPPYNGIVVAVPAGQTLKDLATTYQVRADVLFEVNGCQRSPRLAFIPGVSWSSGSVKTGEIVSSKPRFSDQPHGYPLSASSPVLVGYGWRVNPDTQQVEFHPGVDLKAEVGTPVEAVAPGVVAFAGPQGGYGNLVVINHRDGYQTRYGQLQQISVKKGQRLQGKTALGTVGASGNAEEPHLHFEVRLNSRAGWVAQDPAVYFPEIRPF